MNHPATEISMVCFDAGGVLVRICRTWEEGCAAAGVELRERPGPPEASARRRELNRDYQSGRIDAEAFFQGIAATTAGSYTPEEVRVVHDAWILGEYEGVRTLIDDIHARSGLRTGLLSNTNDGHWRIMGPLRDMAPMRVQHPHASHLLGHVKPDPEIYRAFEAATGAAPGSILLFDDLEENVEAARRAGWHALRVDHTTETEPQMRSHLVSLGLL